MLLAGETANLLRAHGKSFVLWQCPSATKLRLPINFATQLILTKLTQHGLRITSSVIRDA
jgi:hypothetical protein